jgi:aquaporin Z
MRNHLVEYACELAGTAFMMLVGVGAIVLFWADGSPLPRVPVERLRLLITGMVFAGGATLVVYSPVGQRSGAHLNPAVTLGFWRLGKIGTADAIAYAVMQIAGALVGTALVLVLAGDMARGVRLGMTVPGAGVSAPWAVGYEAAITFALMFLILTCLNRPAIAPYTGLAAGGLAATLVALEAPLTGMSVNPARSFAPALLMGDLSAIWIYVVGPPLGALTAAGAWQGRWGARQSIICAKLYHGNHPDRIFAGCPYVAFRAGEVLVREGDEGDAAFVIESGRAQVRKRAPSPGAPGAEGRVLATLGPGDWFGEMSVLLSEPRSATVVALDDGRMRRIIRDTFEAAVTDDRRHAIALLRQLAARVRDANNRMGKMGSDPLAHE